MLGWKEINEGFGERGWCDKTYQQWWEEKGFTEEEVSQWISAGLNFWEYTLASQLKNSGFTPKDYSSFINKNAQEWMDNFYPEETRKEINELNITKKELNGHLDLSEFVNLEYLNISHNKLTFLDLSGCEQIREIRCHSNQLTTLLLPTKGEKLIILGLNNNKLTDSFFFDNPANFNSLWLAYDLFAGKFEALNKLKGLDWYVNNYQYWASNIELLVVANSYRLTEIFPGSDKPVPVIGSEIYEKDKLDCQWIIKTLSQINPQLDTQEALKQFSFFNVRAGSFHGNLNNLFSLFKFNQEETYFLKKIIENLTTEVKKCKEKIVNAYLTFCSEKELLKELINTELEFQKALKEQRVKLRKKKNRIYEELEEKIGAEQMAEVEEILEECGKLVMAELELENKINCHKLIEDIRKEFPKLVINVSQGGNVLIGPLQIGNNVDFSYGKKITYSASSDEPSMNTAENKLETSNFKTLEEAKKERQILDKVNDFLGAKGIFLIARQATIEGLQKCCDKLESSTNKGKYAKLSEAGKTMSGVGSSGFIDVITLGIPKLVGELTNAINNISQRKSHNKRIKEFQKLLTEDKVNLRCFNNAYNSLLSTIQKNDGLEIINSLRLKEKLASEKTKLFDLDYQVYDVVTNIWEDKSYLTPGEMKQAIKLLSDNLKQLKSELEQEEKKIKEIKSGLSKENINLNFASEQEIQVNWKDQGTHFLDFTEEITKEWIKREFTKENCKEWLDIGLKFQDYEYSQWLREEVQITPEQVLNEGSETELRELFWEYKKQQNKQQPQILQREPPPFKSFK